VGGGSGAPVGVPAGDAADPLEGAVGCDVGVSGAAVSDGAPTNLVAVGAPVVGLLESTTAMAPRATSPKTNNAASAAMRNGRPGLRCAIAT
jgi:hypothetical protein